MECIAEQVFFSIFVQFISHLQRKENSCYVMLNPLIIVKPSLFFLFFHGMIRKIVLYCHYKILRFQLQFLFQMKYSIVCSLVSAVLSLNNSTASLSS